MPVLPCDKNSYIVNQIIFLNYDPYEYEYFSKCTFYVVTHVSHTNQIIYNTRSQKRQSIKFQNHETFNFVEKLYFFFLYNQVYIAKHVLKSLHSGFIFRENTNHYKVGG